MSRFRCTYCDTKLGVTTVVSATPAARTKRAECPKCYRVYTLAEVLVQEVTAQGEGAHALAKKIQQGSVQVIVGA